MGDANVPVLESLDSACMVASMEKSYAERTRPQHLPTAYVFCPLPETLRPHLIRAELRTTGREAWLFIQVRVL